MRIHGHALGAFGVDGLRSSMVLVSRNTCLVVQNGDHDTLPGSGGLYRQRVARQLASAAE